MVTRPMPRPTRVLPAALLALALVGGGILWWRATPNGTPDPAQREAPSAREGLHVTPDAAPAAATSPAQAPPPPTEDAVDDLPDIATLPETPWAAVDLEAIREVMPENLFWSMAVPTTDPEVVARRDETRKRWNTEYGKILSNTATAEEIDAYYAERQRLAQDYVDFATYLLATYGEQLGVRDVGLLKVAIELNLARLERLPRDIVEAQERREAHDAARRAWREQQDLFADLPNR